jgi:hypothetical protein
MATYEEKQLKKAAKRAAWLAAPVALVERPLRYLARTLNTETIENGERKVHRHPHFNVALRHALKGNGTVAKQLALMHANS